MRLALAFAAALLATPAAADYSDHRGVTLFTEAPCTAAVSAIDLSLDGMLRSLDDNELYTFGRLAAQQGMAWGFLLGFDTASDGLHGPRQTTLERLRYACALNPETPAIELLRTFSED